MPQTEKEKYTKFFELKFDRGVDEVSAVTDPPIGRLVTMNNWRFSDDADRIEKRNGVTEIAGSSTFGTKDVFGYHTYYDSSSNFCQLTITEEKIWRKVAAGSWTSIHTWASTLAHPVEVHEVQGKQIIVTEIENILILPGGTKVQLGITAPATLPTLTLAYAANILDEDMAGITDWSDDDAGNGATTQVTFDSKSCMKFLNGGSVGDISRRYRTLAELGPEYTFETSIYLDDVESINNDNYFMITIYNGKVKFQMRIDSVGLDIYDGDNRQHVTYDTNRPRIRARRHNQRLEYQFGMISRKTHPVTNPSGTGGVNFRRHAGFKLGDSVFTASKQTIHLEEDKWYTLKIHVDTNSPGEEAADVYLDGVQQGKFPCTYQDTTNPGKVEVALYGSTVATTAYIDWIKMSNVNLGGKLKGSYRYGITYRRGGNYPNESNPILAIVGTATQTGSGLDDLASGGTYTGYEDMTVRVQIDGTGTPDTMKWSIDAGTTWQSVTMPLTETMYLSYGIELTWDATTGHTSGDYWDFTCDALTVDAAWQKVVLSSIPVSSDSQVTQRRIYRSLPGGSTYYLVATINDNTTTSFTDNIPDTMLGWAMSDDNDVAPLGGCSEWWDQKLWIMDKDENIAYFSKTDIPDSFDTSSRYISFRRGDVSEKTSQIKAYKDYLYGLKKTSITYVSRRLDGTYSVREACKGYGCIAPWAVMEVYGLLTFLSYRGWEQFNGERSYPTLFSKPIRKTLKTIDKTNLKYITSVHLSSRNEIWLSIPDRTGSASAITCVLNYMKREAGFYTFSFSKTPSSLNVIEDSGYAEQVVMGTRDGYIGTCESGTQDFGTNITATARMAWVRFPKYANFRLAEFEYQAPTANTILVDPYVNLGKTSKGQRSLTGKTPTSTDQSLRFPIKDDLGFDLRGKYLALKFTNAENIGDDIKINHAIGFYRLIARKGKIEPD